MSIFERRCSLPSPLFVIVAGNGDVVVSAVTSQLHVHVTFATVLFVIAQLRPVVRFVISPSCHPIPGAIPRHVHQFQNLFGLRCVL